MKEATGGALLMGLAAMLIMVFIIVVAFFISYGKSFRLKNTIINQLEQREGMTRNQVRDFFTGNSNVYNGKKVGICYQRHMVGTEVIGLSYQVVVYMQLEATSILGQLEIPIKGETRIIEKGNYFNIIKTSHPSQLQNINKCSIGYTTINV